MEHIHSERAAPAFALEPLVPNALEPIHDRGVRAFQSFCARQEPHFPKAGSAIDQFAPDFEPFKQGQLDCLCGIYAIFNAINLASGEQTIDQYEASVILSTIMPMAIELASTPKEGFIGLSGDELELLAKVICHGFATGGPELSLQDPERLLCRPDEKHLSKTQIFRRTQSRGNCALIVQVRAKSTFHWSVFLNREGKHIDLFDSAHCDSVHMKHCKPWKMIGC